MIQYNVEGLMLNLDLGLLVSGWAIFRQSILGAQVSS